MWLTFGLSSFGDWLGLLATSLFAAGQVSGPTAKGLAFGGVVIARLLPTIVLGPLAGAFADRFDRRLTMVVCDLVRFVLFASIPLVAVVGSAPVAVGWALVATFVIEVVGMFWNPAKEASVPNLVPRDQLEAANQLSLIVTYGVTPLLAVFIGAGLNRLLLSLVRDDPSRLRLDPNDAALYLNAFTFLVAAVVVFTIREISTGEGRLRRSGPAGVPEPSLPTALLDGWKYAGRTPLVRGLVLGILGAFAAGGVVVGVGQFFARGLGGGDATFYLLFGSLFVGLAGGMGLGPSLVRGLSRRRWFCASIGLSGLAVAVLPFSLHLSMAIPLTVLAGAGAGMAYLAGTTLLGAEVPDAMRGRVFAFVQSTVRVVLLLAIAVSSLLVGVGGGRKIPIGAFDLDFSAARVLLFVSGLLAIIASVLSFRAMDDKPGVPLLRDLYSTLRGHSLPVAGDRSGDGLFIVFEGGEGAGKSTQSRALTDWLTGRGFEVVSTREPGATPLGREIRSLILDHRDDAPSSRSEALLYAADRAHHVATVIRPALARGAVVVCDRYVDSSLAYQGAGRDLATEDVEWLSRWATAGLVPDLVILLDVDPSIGLTRVGNRGVADRLEAESMDFHQRVRRAFLDRAAADQRRYLVLDAGSSAGMLADRIKVRVAPLLKVHPDINEPLPQAPAVPASVGASSSVAADAPGAAPASASGSTAEAGPAAGPTAGLADGLAAGPEAGPVAGPATGPAAEARPDEGGGDIGSKTDPGSSAEAR
ncbi:thymidylate kinase [Cryptosporangium arvum DSM 44712]|uniref:Thymidylate kinase n=1 Tax=Cryptosporangium arvum DSM 44712 TaxID=927661 RepID=A0A010ZQ55_9ACTN|nr:thymidylate kinase [Cryptosporangium arvum DSM 44712]